jgi:hypothetical protein
MKNGNSYHPTPDQLSGIELSEEPIVEPEIRESVGISEAELALPRWTVVDDDTGQLVGPIHAANEACAIVAALELYGSETHTIRVYPQGSEPQPHRKQRGKMA